MNKIVSAEIGFLRILEQRDKLKQKVELRLLNSEVNRNNWQYVNLEAHRARFAQTPILVAYVGKRIGDGHNFRMVKTKDGEEVASFMDSTAERIVGWFNNEEDIRIENIDGTEWIIGTGYIWVWYAQELVEKLKKQGLEGMSVSIETLVYEMHKNGSTEVFTKYEILGTTILGDDVDPAVKGANIKALSALGEKGVHELTLKVASAQEQGNNNPQKNTKKGVKQMENNFNLEDLRDKFPGYTVLAVNGNNVALLSDKGRTAFYSFADGEVTVVTERIKQIAVNCVFGSEDDGLSVSAETVVSAMRTRLNETQNALTEETKRANDLQVKLDAMEKEEHDRRVKVAKDAVKDQMSKNNKGRDCELDEKICEDLLEDEYLEKCANMVDEKGTWCGEKEIRKEVDARCMEAIRKETAEKRNNATKDIFSWRKNLDAPEEGEGADKALKNTMNF